MQKDGLLADQVMVTEGLMKNNLSFNKIKFCKNYSLHLCRHDRSRPGVPAPAEAESGPPGKHGVCSGARGRNGHGGVLRQQVCYGGLLRRTEVSIVNI